MLEEGIILCSNQDEFFFHKTMDDLLRAIRDKATHPYLREDLPDLGVWVGREISAGTVRKKQYLKDLKTGLKSVSSWIDTNDQIPDDDEVATLTSDMTTGGMTSLIELLSRKVFNFVKPPSLIQGLVKQATAPGDIVLDFFAGSATTAQAVMAVNSAEPGESQRFIMVSSVERTAKSSDQNFCRDITVERIRRVNASREQGYADLTARFAYLRCKGIAFEDMDYDLSQDDAWAALESLHGLPLTTRDSS